VIAQDHPPIWRIDSPGSLHQEIAFVAVASGISAVRKVASDNDTNLRFIRTFDDAGSGFSKLLGEELSHLTECRTRARKRSNFARPYICRLINFRSARSGALAKQIPVQFALHG
jgi:hypothetical protein